VSKKRGERGHGKKNHKNQLPQSLEVGVVRQKFWGGGSATNASSTALGGLARLPKPDAEKTTKEGGGGVTEKK